VKKDTAVRKWVPIGNRIYDEKKKGPGKKGRHQNKSGAITLEVSSKGEEYFLACLNGGARDSNTQKNKRKEGQKEPSMKVEM